MKIAVFSDIHDNLAALEQVMEDATRHGATSFYCLGDVGSDRQILARLRAHGIRCTFGNWEVSGLARMEAADADWVGAWPARLAQGDALLCHASPDMPAGAATTEGAAALVRTGVGWSALFPRLHTNEEARWQALAVLEETNMRAAFHGHTHVQDVWAWQDQGTGGRRLTALGAPEHLVLHPGRTASPNRFIVGVGSIGQPQDGPRGAYVLWEPARMTVELRRLPR